MSVENVHFSSGLTVVSLQEEPRTSHGLWRSSSAFEETLASFMGYGLKYELSGSGGKKPSQAFCEPRPCEFPLPTNDLLGQTSCSLRASLLNIAM